MEHLGRFESRFKDRLAPFTLLGSGDFHHLSLVWTKHIEGEFTLVSFDNHPDWDRRPPRYACGGWVCRVLERERVRGVSVWGCGNFELSFPNRVFGLQDPRLTIRPWSERLKPVDRARYQCIDRGDWREQFDAFAGSLAGQRVYITVDLDCLASGYAATNWENGLFTSDDICWALGRLRERASVVGGDVCGAWSQPRHERWTQRFAANWDHPRIEVPSPAAIAATTQTMVAIWRALTG